MGRRRAIIFYSVTPYRLGGKNFLLLQLKTKDIEPPRRQERQGKRVLVQREETRSFSFLNGFPSSPTLAMGPLRSALAVLAVQPLRFADRRKLIADSFFSKLGLTLTGQNL